MGLAILLCCIGLRRIGEELQLTTEAVVIGGSGLSSCCVRRLRRSLLVRRRPRQTPRRSLGIYVRAGVRTGTRPCLRRGSWGRHSHDPRLAPSQPWPFGQPGVEWHLDVVLWVIIPSWCVSGPSVSGLIVLGLAHKCGGVPAPPILVRCPALIANMAGSLYGPSPTQQLFVGGSGIDGMVSFAVKSTVTTHVAIVCMH